MILSQSNCRKFIFYFQNKIQSIMDKNLAGFDALAFAIPMVPTNGAEMTDSQQQGRFPDQRNPDPSPQQFEDAPEEQEGEFDQFADSSDDHCSGIFSQIHIRSTTAKQPQNHPTTSSTASVMGQTDSSVISELTNHSHDHPRTIPRPVSLATQFSDPGADTNSHDRSPTAPRPQGGTVVSKDSHHYVSPPPPPGLPSMKPQSPSDNSDNLSKRRTVPLPITTEYEPCSSTFQRRQTSGSSENTTTSSATHSPHPTTNSPYSVEDKNAPQKALYSFLGRPPTRYIVKPTDYVVWDNGGEAHDLWFTAAFVHPSGVFYSGRWSNSKGFKEGREERPLGTAPLIYYSKKNLAKHAAAARALDCLVYQERPESSNPNEWIGQDDPSITFIPGPIHQDVQEQIYAVQEEVRQRQTGW